MDGLRIRNQDETFAGCIIQQTYSALWHLEQIIMKNKFKTVIELGTGHGALCVFFSLHGQETFTYQWENDNREIRVKELHECLKIHFVLKDVLKECNVKEIMSVNRPLLLFCDNGNKEKEFELYTPELKKGDYIIVHDREIEFFPNSEKNLDIEKRNNLIRINDQEMINDGTLLTVYRKD